MRHLKIAFPTPVGMNRVGVIIGRLICCVPHTRGDEPPFAHLWVAESERSPHPWG